MNYDVTKLDKALREAGIPITGVDCKGGVYFLSEATDEQKTAANTIVQDFDSSSLTQEEIVRSARIQAESYLEKKNFSATVLVEVLRGTYLNSPKAKEAQAWSKQIKAEALAHPANPNFEQFTLSFGADEVLAEIDEIERNLQPVSEP